MALLLVLHLFFNIEISFIADKPITIFIISFSHNLGVLYARPLAITDFFRVYLRILQVLCKLLLVNLGFRLIDSLFNNGSDTETLVGIMGPEIEPEVADHCLGALSLYMYRNKKRYTCQIISLTYLEYIFASLLLSFGCLGL